MARVVSVKLSAQVSEYVAGMTEAANKTRAVGTEGEKLAQKQQAFQTLGTAATVVGGAMTALTLSVAKTGIEYNQLQQSSRAALTTLLGGAEAANAQMDKLDAFARTSPFSKSTFITAQQQMLAFGIESKKVIPYLDSIQDAVAAAGGSNQQLSEVAFVIAQIGAAGKITGQDLLQFGQRGINAAELIGSQMGKTGAQIKAEITAGTLGADEALDALTAGMKDKFGGAADSVKDTFAGAMDRVQAAWRDMSADLMAPLVNPNGGGLFVELLNGLADVMRGFQSLPAPIKIAGGAIFALVGLVTLASGVFLGAVPKIAEYNIALASLGSGAQRASRLIGTLAKGGAAAVGFLALAKGAEMAATAMGQMGEGAKTANETLSLMLSKDYDSIFAGIVPSINDMSDALDALLSSDPGEAFNRWGSDLFAFTGLSSNVGEARKQFALMGEALADMVNDGKPEQAAAQFEAIKEKAKELGYSTDQLNDLMPQYQDALVGVANESASAADATGDAADATGDLEQAAADAQGALDAMKASLDGIAGSAMDMAEAKDAALSAIQDLTSAAKEEGAAIDGTNEASIKLRDSVREVEQSHRDSAQAIIENGGTLADAQVEWQKGRDAVIGMLEAKGLDNASAVAWADQQLGSASEVKGGIDAVYQAWLDLPENKETKYQVYMDGALAKLEEVRAKISQIPGYRSITLETITIGNRTIDSGANYQGGMYANGMKHFASGGFASGIYAGVMGGIRDRDRIFAEKDMGVPWETYISGRAQDRNRNIGIWQQTGQMLGVGGGGSAASVTPVVYVQNPFTGDYLLAQVSSVAGAQVSAYDASANRASRGGVRP